MHPRGQLGSYSSGPARLKGSSWSHKPFDSTTRRVWQFLLMNRKSFLKHLAAIPILAAIWRFLPISIQAAMTSSTVRRVRPSDRSWPTAASWEKLKHQVGGQLMPVSSPLAPCRAAPGSTACAARIEEMKNPYFIGEQAGGTQTSGWLEGWTSAPSTYAVAARRTEDVVAAVNFARDNNLRLVIKGGGHSYQGTSNAADSLLIWTREMHKITLHDSFVPEGFARTEPRHAVTIEAGARWLPTYNAVTTKAGRYVQGGGCATVGVAGLIQSGGFGSFSKNYGLAAASLLQAEIVTADGKALIANASTNPDLFWALKGGGGGTFGVVTKVTLATYELPAFFGRVQGLIKANSDAAFRKLIGVFMRFYHETLFNPYWGESVTWRATLYENMRRVIVRPGLAFTILESYSFALRAEMRHWPFTSKSMMVASANPALFIISNTLSRSVPRESFPTTSTRTWP